ncbi:acyclic terpene utilization AtuA family protein [Pseudescherichia vulneris]|uniref:acyclic terpene utilization AtuA family protein n=1 Tax=Pseudescherichia vulneris TaxID=566 RepID=UPI0028AE5F04|nr:acyclic terpene utilization AtuA family protein [Pseudescherichia vulneris]
MAKTFKILSPTAILGYGFPEESFLSALAESPDLIAVDAGSSDPGPHYLGAGKPFTDRAGVKRDLRYMISAGVKQGIPVVIGTAGGSGAAPHLAWCREIVLEIAREEQLSFTLATIPADVDKQIVHQALDADNITALDFVPPLTHQDIDDSTSIVAQMGVEPFQRALAAGAQVVLGGRAYDPACFAALPIMQGFDEGLALHCGKILECAAIAATPGSGSDCAMGILDEHGFTLKVFNPKRKFTETSAAAHTLYEKSDPYFLPGPGGVLNLQACTFKAVNESEVYVSGSRHETTPYRLKLEGARLVGYRCLTIAGVRDPIMIASIETILEEVKSSVIRNLSLNAEEIRITFHLYGKNGVMGEHEPVPQAGHELGIVLDVVAPDQPLANSVCSLVRSTLLHYGYEGRIATAGNLAFPFSPSDVPCGPIYEFSVYHLIEASEALKFPFVLEQVTPEGVVA